MDHPGDRPRYQSVPEEGVRSGPRSPAGMGAAPSTDSVDPDVPAPQPRAAWPRGRRARIATLLITAFLCGGLGGAGAWGLLHRAPEPYPTMATPSSAWTNGATELWSVPLDPTSVASDVGTSVELVTTPTRVAVIQAISDEDMRVTGLALTSADQPPVTMWDQAVPPGGSSDSQGLAGWWGDHFVLSEQVLPIDDAAFPTPSVDTHDILLVLPKDILLTCSDGNQCAAWDAEGKKAWEQGLIGPVSGVGALIRAEDGHVIVPVLPGGSSAQLLDATTGELSPLDTTGIDWELAVGSNSVLRPMRDGWIAYSSDYESIVAWDSHGRQVDGVHTLAQSHDQRAFVVSPGGLATTADMLSRSTDTTAPPAGAVVVAPTAPVGDECPGVTINGTAVDLPPALDGWLKPSAEDGGSCGFTNWSDASVSDDGSSALAFFAPSRGSASRVVVLDAAGHTISWVSEPLAAATLVRPDLLITVDEGGTTLTGWGPTSSGSDAATSSPPSPPVEGAHTGAGGPVPAEAEEATAIWDSGPGTSAALILSPSGNIGCDLTDASVGCGVASLLEDRSLGSDPIGTRWFIGFDGQGVPEVTSNGGAPGYMLAVEGQAPVVPQVVAYGQVVSHGRFVCASEEAGMTCWDSTTGHGAFLTDDRIEGF